ncbi:hypothetical protein [Glycomyces harbinensis]|uniref:Uncharacterized protein n=1 Tax=Glycomyces harbinensis TaxID=58114 RepID=A0A1G6TVA0_9ACTN|nr:hypothetical protein [Glycomyces harbinensis]SDD33030.1 hypothetical protein SAMN05216270_103176 [Glycomyces harbinensis]
MSHDEWGPRYGDPSHPTTGELPRVGNGQSTDELRTVQVDTVAEPPRQESRSRYRYSWETSEPRQASEPPGAEWSVPRVGREGSAPRMQESPPRSGPQPPVRRDDTAQFARVGDGLRGSVGPVSVQIDHVRLDGGTSGDTQLLPTASFMRPKPEEIPDAVEAPQPEPGTGSMPAMRRQMGPDWTQTPLRLLAAAVVATAVLGASAASLISIGNWINP